MNDDELVRYHHKAGFSLPAPRRWQLRENPRDKVAAVFLAPEGGGRFRPNLVVTLDDLSSDESLLRWQQAAEDVASQLLDQYVLIDTEVRESDSDRVYWRLAHHAAPGGVAVTIQQWATVRAGHGYTLTATTSTEDLPHIAGLFTAVAHGFRVDDPEVGRS